MRGLILSVRILTALSATLLLYACADESPDERLDRIASTYVELSMHLDRLRPGEIDVWFGPERLDSRGTASESSFELIAEAAAEMSDELGNELSLRGARLKQRIVELEAVAAYLASPTKMSYAEQTTALYDVPWIDTERSLIDASLAAIDQSLPGRGSVRARMASLRRRLVIPAEQRRIVFQAALDECRRRTLTNWELPEDESIELIWTRDVDAAWHRFDGKARSTLWVNPLAVATIDQSLDLACHETYPGHHAQFVLFELSAPHASLALEDQLVLLRSPVSAFREAAAMNAVHMVFTAEERTQFEREVLFPLAGLKPEDADLLYRIRPHLEQVALAIPLIIRDHEDRELSDAEALNRLQSEALVASPRALFAFAHEVGALLAGYTILNAELASHLQGRTKSEAWASLRRALENPRQWREAL
ncbi:MAG: hypothetical protein AAF671_09065 [Pseudomonadota bacterium]